MLSEEKPIFIAPSVEDTETVSFQLIVSDGIDGDSNPSTVDITVEPPEGNFIDPGPPIADAGQDQIVNREESIQLDGTGSHDPDGDAIWPVSWEQTSGNPSVELSGTDTLEPTFIAPSVKDDEVLSFELIVSDGFYNSDPSTVDVTITSSSVGTENEDVKMIDATNDQGKVGTEEEYDWNAILLLSGVVVAIIGTISMIKKLTHHHLVEVRTRGKIEYY